MFALPRFLAPCFAVLASASAQFEPFPPVQPVPITPAEPVVWNMAGDLLQPRLGHTATLLPNGKVLIYAGYFSAKSGQQLTTLSSSELFDPVTRTWGSPTSTFYARAGHQATLLLNGRVLFVWTLVGHMNVARTGHTLTALPDGRVLAAGGTNYTDPQLAQRTSELFNSGFGVVPRRNIDRPLQPLQPVTRSR